MAGEKQTWFRRDYEIDIAPGNLQLLAVNLPPESWSLLVDSMAATPRLQTARGDGFNESPEKSEDMTAVVDTASATRKAIDALLESGTPPRASSSPSRSCRTTRSGPG